MRSDKFLVRASLQVARADCVAVRAGRFIRETGEYARWLRGNYCSFEFTLIECAMTLQGTIAAPFLGVLLPKVYLLPTELQILPFRSRGTMIAHMGNRRAGNHN